MIDLYQTQMFALIALPDKFSEPLLDYFSGDSLPDFIGRDAPFERNRAAQDEQIQHIHFCYFKEINHKWLNKSQFQRTSNNFIIYTRHWRFDKLCCVLAVVTPDAHQRIDNLLPQLIQQAQWFNGLGREELAQLDWFKK